MLWWTLRQLKSKNFDTRREAVSILGESGNPKAVEPLIALLQGSCHQKYVARALGKIGDARAVEPLIATLKDSSRYVREEAAISLGWIGDTRAVQPLIAALQDSSSDVRKHAAKALEALRYEPKDATQQAMVFVAKTEWGNAVMQGPAAVEPLINVFTDSNSYLRKCAAEALGKIGNARAIESLIVALKDSDYDVKREAEKALGKIGEAAVEPLIVALKDSSFGERQKAVDLLGQIGDARAVEPLIVALKDSDYGVKREAAKALGKIGDSRAVEPLIAVLRGSDKYMQEKAAEALGKIGDVVAIEPLTMLLLQGNYQVGYDVLPALEKLGWNPTTDQEQASVKQVQIYREQLRHRANREEERHTKIETKVDSGYWKCPKCGAILVKPMSAGLRSVLSGRIEGNATCVPCGAAFSASDVYGGKYDVHS